MDLVNIAFLYFGTSYVWGGNTPEQGLDCSGFVSEVARSYGYLDSRDRNAQMLHDEFSEMEGVRSQLARNSILFFGKHKSKITHTAIAVDDRLMIEAGGEGRVETDKGYVRIRPINL
ncbi:MAG: C40 family peptidase, partial [Flavobacteriaceae bacterium]|nr:C40 family peptidase [Flavobacteriaceae bacterium]